MKEKETKEQKGNQKTYLKVEIENMSGQRTGVFVMFKGMFSCEDDILCCIPKIIYEDPNMEYLCYIHCKDEQLKIDLIKAIAKQLPNLNQSTRPIAAGSDWGFNIIIEDDYTWPHEQRPSNCAEMIEEMVE